MGITDRPRLRALDPSAAATIAAWLIVALALAARLFRADAQSLWYDEGTSAQLATRTAREIVTAAAGDIHPPLYYLLLAAWSRLFGHGVVALRALSAVLGTAQVAATLAIGRRMGGSRLGLVAGLLAATSPYLIWYGQEVRMYVLAGALGACLVALAVSDVDALVRRGDGVRAGDRGAGDRGADVAVRPVAAAARTALIALVATAALYTQYLAGAAAVAVGGAVIALGWAAVWRRRGVLPRASMGRWIGAYAVAAALFAPWIARAWPVLRDWPALGAPVALGFVGREAVGTYAVGVKGPVTGWWWWAMMAGVVVVGAAWAWRPGSLRRGRPVGDAFASPLRGGVLGSDGVASGAGMGERWRGRWAVGVAIVVAVVPPVLVWVASLRRPAWNPKFIIAGAPGFELLLALGVVGIAEAVRGWWTARATHASPLRGGAGGGRRAGDAEDGGDGGGRWRRRGGSIVGAVVGAIALGIVFWPRLVVWRANAYDAAYQRDNYRGIAAEIAARAGPDDAVVLNAPTQVEVFGFYDRGAHATFPLPIGRPVDVEATNDALAALGARHRDVHAVLWATNESDPDGRVEAWLNANRYKVDDRWFGNVRLATWVADRQPSSRPVTANSVVFGAVIELMEVVAAPARPGTGAYGGVSPERRPLVLDARAGDYMTLDVTWRAVRPADGDYVVFTQLVDRDGRMVTTRDMRPHGGMLSTSDWRASPLDGSTTPAEPYDSGTPDGPVLDLIALRVPPDTQPGDGYRLVLGLYDPATGQRLAPDTGGDAFEVARVTVTPR
ncbi:MAG: glycosyltransferase family 39 protein [Ardenticatenales bacterium]|nr:glycosyltransferase family 39 protein [Ardenticatenales bacterium]